LLLPKPQTKVANSSALQGGLWASKGDRANLLKNSPAENGAFVSAQQPADARFPSSMAALPASPGVASRSIGLQQIAVFSPKASHTCNRLLQVKH
jgi:hypothetical protein